MATGVPTMKIYRWSEMALLAWFVLTIAVVAGAEPSAADKQTKAERLEAILTETLPESDYREMTRCLSTHAYRNVEILSDRYLLFKGTHDRVWVNRLRQRCSGLRRNVVLQFRLSGSNICANDLVSVWNPLFRSIGASCALGQFEEIDEQRAVALQKAFRAAGRS